MEWFRAWGDFLREADALHDAFERIGIGSFGEVFSLSESLRGDSPPRREARKDVAPTISARPTGGGGLGTDFDLDGGLIAAIQERAVSENADAGPDGVGVRTDGVAYTLEARQTVQAVAYGGNNQSGPIDVATALNAHGGPCGRQDFESETFISHALRGEGFDASEDGTGRGTPLVPTRAAVRRLTPEECEALQGFPRSYTATPYRGGIAADGPRYKALGNSMAVPCMAWIGQRIAAVDALT